MTTPEKPFSFFGLPLWTVIPAFIVMESAVVLIINGASDPTTGKPRYNTGSVVMFQELLKLSISLYGLSKVAGGFSELRQASVSSWLKYGVPGLLYCINNNLFHHVLAGSMPAAFQVLLQIRALWTGIMFWLLQGRRLSGQQWGALVVLCIGAIVTQAKSDDSDGDSAGALSMTALVLTLAYTWISVGAGVYNETLLKTGGSRSIHLANVPLYTWGVIFNLLVLMMQGSDEHSVGFWAGWDLFSTWVLLFLQAFVGLGVSVVMRQYDNVVKIMCVAGSNILVYVINVTFMGYDINTNFVIGGAMVLAAAVAYTKAKDVPKQPPPSPVRA